MSSKDATITGWFGYKKPDGQTTVTITGKDFGAVPGSVKLIGQGLGAVRAQIVSWTDKAIVVIAPNDTRIMRVMVYTLNERGKEKTAVITPATEVRETYTPEPTWEVDSIDDTEDAIIIEGSSLEDVVDVFLYDAGSPQLIAAAAHALDGDTLIVDWPAAFSGSITNVILSDGNEGNVSENAQSPALVPAPNGILTDVSAEAVGGTSILHLIGSGLGTAPGSVVLVRDGGDREPAAILSNGWSPSVVSVAATPAQAYESVELTRSDNEIAQLATSFPGIFAAASVANGPTVTYDPDTDVMTITSPDPIFGHGDGLAYVTEQYGGGYGLSTASDQMVVLNPHVMIVEGADAKIVGPNTVITHIDFFNDAGPVASWDGSVTIAAA